MVYYMTTKLVMVALPGNTLAQRAHSVKQCGMGSHLFWQ